MVNFFADALDGNDANDGLSFATAKKTILAAAIAASNDDVVECAGVFQETVSESAYGNARLTFNARGAGQKFAILDGDGILAIGMNMNGVTFAVGTTWNDFIVRNYTAFGAHREVAGGFTTLNLNRCIFEDNDVGVDHEGPGGSNSRLFMIECLVRNNPSAGVKFETASGGVGNANFINNCTITGNGNGIETVSTTAMNFRLQNSILSHNTRHIEHAGSGVYTSPSDANCIDFNSGDANFKGSIETTLAGWRTASGEDAVSISTDPLYVDRLKNLHRLSTSSPCLVNGSLIFGTLIQGAFIENPAEGISNNVNNSIWTNGVISTSGAPTPTDDLEIDGSGNYVLAAGKTVGSVSLVIDFGETRDIQRINLSFLYDWTTSIPDFDITDSLPVTWTFRIRTSVDATPPAGAFTEVDWLTNVSLAGVQQIEIEITIRNDA